ncbi:Asp-tRNA(Asn)/Glu-tRNA(Gln) amidotransferase subunit GatB [Patescibacteria group bacterium]|nr:Asp-tRNA(Asn)/Glu-tRNA(Gln) amidotransferase subunit GatB [Patescibacteria group bacterium]MBU4512863.1 Asp-tRNA(Asn)/Glu-tRNA(Gln) amidotransferase subunit GatB [Patescibacteria group bacterium]MCG2693637.1 Asp-tRNA(Asn)/Glu-tRNA(Gln) amidotransferase subunit GatB [Candidatus Parcubacteria bacterium]
MQEKYIPIIGLEIHSELKTKSKMFCNCDNDPGGKAPNSVICPICTGQPGTLPVPNRQAIEWTILTGLALNCQIAKQTKFDRKNYFYPDLPKGYQISQYDQPICFKGYIEIKSDDPEAIRDKRVDITRIHLEEDTGKLVHPQGSKSSNVDFNRAGTPLMELVTEPDMHTAMEAKNLCQEFQKILRYLDVSNANMEKGEMRCEANISVQQTGKWRKKGSEVIPVGKYKLNPKVEVKNLNSFKAVERAIEYEINRQTKLLNQGKAAEIVQETRGWDEAKGVTFSQREKESAHDYRYFPEPDIPSLEINQTWIKQIKKKLPELPRAKKNRFMGQYDFASADAQILVSNPELADYTEQVLSELHSWLISTQGIEESEDEIWGVNKKKMAKLVAGWLINKLGALMIQEGATIDKLKITPENFAEFITLVYESKINSAAAQKILAEMYKTGADPSHILQEKDLSQTSDKIELSSIIAQVIKNNPNPVAQYKKGKEGAIMFLVGRVMKQTKGRANPTVVQKILREKLV